MCEHKICHSGSFNTFTQNHKIITIGLAFILGYFIHILYMFYISFKSFLKTSYDLEIKNPLNTSHIFILIHIQTRFALKSYKQSHAL